MRRFGALAATVYAVLGSTVAHAEVTSLSGAPYDTHCQTRLVPLPPPWRSSAWKFSGAMTGDQLVIVRERPAHVYYYQSTSPPGICMALPRPDGTTVPEAAFGVICHGTDGRKACFWDNAKPIADFNNPNGPLINIASTDPTKLDGTFIGGAALKKLVNGECSDCHAGENPFVIHPNTPLDLNSKYGINLRSNWYDPIVQSGWSQNPGPSFALDSVPLTPDDRSCLDCHNGNTFPRLPTLSKANFGYCSNLDKIRNKLKYMPPFEPKTGYDKHWEALETACRSDVTSSSTTTAMPNARRYSPPIEEIMVVYDMMR